MGKFRHFHSFQISGQFLVIPLFLTVISSGRSVENARPLRSVHTIVIWDMKSTPACPVCHVAAREPGRQLGPS